ncbi:MAG TPA: GntR family transcriptional regulator [Tepidisphaeraceae bacterium]|jgi:DNA-binding transcriptional regulator YhcF (GntR family)|nr:GntR family transcriptional regulator [Tepidisphaeraceae bacterium]
MGVSDAGDSTGIRLSYKFQRLREELRAAVASGELAGKLPGERELARRFNVNAKTLSKALTDLAAEGLLERSIGRGTYVKGTSPASEEMDKWLLVCDPDQMQHPVLQALLRMNAGAQITHDVRQARPSFINQFTAVVDLARNTPEAFLRDLRVRGVQVVAVDREPRVFSIDAVLPDRMMATARVARSLLLIGHRQFAAVERQGCREVCDALRTVAERFDASATVDSCYPEEVGHLLDYGITAIVCDASDSAQRVMSILGRAGVNVPGQISVAAVGYGGSSVVCDGTYADAQKVAETVAMLLRDTQSRQPTTLWMAGGEIELGTTGHAANPVEIRLPRRIEAGVAV